MKIGILGSGYVGQSIGIFYSELGHDILFHDIDKNTLSTLQMKGYSTTTNISDVVEICDCLLICVPTLTSNTGKMNLGSILMLLKSCGEALKEVKKEPILVVKSTILPGTIQNVMIPMIEKYSNKKVDKDVGVIYSPEFITEINATWTTNKNSQITPSNEGRVVLGEGGNKDWGDTLIKELYSHLKCPVIRTDYKTAEMIKYASNCMLATKISYWNEIFLICQKLGIDSKKVAEAVTLDPRIGKYGSVHGKAFGGKCLPKDLKAFISFTESMCNIKILKAVDEVNAFMKKNYGVRE